MRVWWTLLKRSPKASARDQVSSPSTQESHHALILYWATLVGQGWHIRYLCGICNAPIQVTYAGFDPLLEIVPGGGYIQNLYPIPPLWQKFFFDNKKTVIYRVWRHGRGWGRARKCSGRIYLELGWKVGTFFRAQKVLPPPFPNSDGGAVA